MYDIKGLVEGIYDEVVELRRDFHMHPEMSTQEKRTAKIIAEKLREYGMDEVQEGLTGFGTGVIGLLKGTAGPGKCLAIRGDTDALPVTEDTGLPFASQTPGVMHACGHDGHIAVLLGTAKVLASLKDRLHGSVKFLFQPAEEVAPAGGSRPMMEAGALENPHVDAIIAGHIFPSEKPGQILLYKGGVTTGFNNYDIEFIGKSAHGSQPQNSNDAILAACQFVVALQQIGTHRIDPLKTAIIGANVIKGGTVVNIIPGYAMVQVCARTYENAVAEIVRQEIYKLADGIAKISGCEVKITFSEGYSPVNNDPGLIELVDKACGELLGEGHTRYLDRPMAFSEDYGRFMDDAGIPGAQIFFEVGHLGDEIYPLHNPKMAWQEEGMKLAIAAFAATAVKYLGS